MSKKSQNEQLRELRERQKKEELAKKQREQSLIMLISIATLALILIAVAISVLVTKLNSKNEETTPEETTADLSNAPILYDLADTNIYTASETTTNYVKLNVSYTADNGQRHNGDIIVKLDPENAPITVANFQKLVGEGFYDGLIFHRVMENFMIQGGDPKGNGTGGSDEDIKGEFSANGVNNTIKHERGVISMARSGEQYDAYGNVIDTGYDSASSQFFIVHQTSPHLNGQYAAFGHVVFGMTSVDGIATVSTNSNNKPLRDAKIVSAVFVNYTEQSQ